MILTNYATARCDSVHITNGLQIISIAINLSHAMLHNIYIASSCNV